MSWKNFILVILLPLSFGVSQSQTLSLGILQVFESALPASPASCLTLRATKMNGPDIQISWEVNFKKWGSPEKYILEKSLYDCPFETLGDFAHSDGINKYEFLDDQKKGHLNAYRVKVVFSDGFLAYSNVVECNIIDNHRDRFWVLSPVTKDAIVLFTDQSDFESFIYTIIDREGKDLIIGKITGKQTRIDVKELPPSSSYYILIEGEEGHGYINRFIKE